MTKTKEKKPKSVAMQAAIAKDRIEKMHADRDDKVKQVTDSANAKIDAYFDALPEEVRKAVDALADAALAADGDD
jgi:hypothetical protein